MEMQDWSDEPTTTPLGRWGGPIAYEPSKVKRELFGDIVAGIMAPRWNARAVGDGGLIDAIGIISKESAMSSWARRSLICHSQLWQDWAECGGLTGIDLSREAWVWVAFQARPSSIMSPHPVSRVGPWFPHAMATFRSAPRVVRHQASRISCKSWPALNKA